MGKYEQPTAVAADERTDRQNQQLKPRQPMGLNLPSSRGTSCAHAPVVLGISLLGLVLGLDQAGDRGQLDVGRAFVYCPNLAVAIKLFSCGDA